MPFHIRAPCPFTPTGYHIDVMKVIDYTEGEFVGRELAMLKVVPTPEGRAEVLRVTEMLRSYGVVGKFVEFFGSGLEHMPVANRATIANMAPEYGATIGFFPVDEQTLTYMELTGRPVELIDTVRQYCMAQRLWRDEARPIAYADVLELDLGTVEPSLAGPKRPQDRVPLSRMKADWHDSLTDTFNTPMPSETVRVDSWDNDGGLEPDRAPAGTLQARGEFATVSMEGESCCSRSWSVCGSSMGVRPSTRLSASSHRLPRGATIPTPPGGSRRRSKR